MAAERSFIAIKQDMLQRGLVGEILGRFERKGFGFPAPPDPGPGSPRAVAVIVVAASLLVIGVLGFAMGGMHQLFSTEGAELIIFRLNPFQNILHLVLGGLLLGAAVRSARTIRIAAVTGAIALLVLTGVGIAMEGGATKNYLAGNTADHVFHATTAAILFCALALRTGSPGQPT